MANQNPFILAADNNPNLLSLLRTNPALASSQDEHGYSILHAAASYNHLDLLRHLIDDFQVDQNIRDEDGETALFVVETVEAAKVLIEDLRIDPAITNVEGLTAEEKIRAEGDYTTVADFLRETRLRRTPDVGTNEEKQPASLMDGPFVDNVHPPPPPPNVRMNISTINEETSDGSVVVDSEFRKRIEGLAAREDFQEEEGQRQLRELITDAVRGVEVENAKRDVRRRIE